MGAWSLNVQHISKECPKLMAPIGFKGTPRPPIELNIRTSVASLFDPGIALGIESNLPAAAFTVRSGHPAHFALSTCKSRQS